MELDIVPGDSDFILAAKPHQKAQARPNASVRRVGLVTLQVWITPPESTLAAADSTAVIRTNRH